MTINIPELLEYFDLKESTKKGDATAAISVAGEDLNAGIFKHFCENEHNSTIRIIDPNLCAPNLMRRKGKHLDRWIYEQNKSGDILYQTEIKNWCSRAIKGIDIPLDIDDETLDELANKNWLNLFPGFEAKKVNVVNKVLIKMVSDQKITPDENFALSDSYKKEPLLIFWDARKPKTQKDYFFKYKLATKYFDYGYCWIFSCSLYLRRLLKRGETEILIEMPNVDRRLEQLNKIF